MSNNISQKVAAWRSAAGLSQADAAAHVGVSAVVFNRIERGARFPASDTAALFIAAGVFKRDEWADGLLAAVSSAAA